jgi:hypothetical protein
VAAADVFPVLLPALVPLLSALHPAIKKTAISINAIMDFFKFTAFFHNFLLGIKAISISTMHFTPLRYSKHLCKILHILAK